MNHEHPRDGSANTRANKKLMRLYKRELKRNPRYKGMSQGDAFEKHMFRVIDGKPI